MNDLARPDVKHDGSNIALAYQPFVSYEYPADLFAAADIFELGEGVLILQDPAVLDDDDGWLSVEDFHRAADILQRPHANATYLFRRIATCHLDDSPEFQAKAWHVVQWYSDHVRYLPQVAFNVLKRLETGHYIAGMGRACRTLLRTVVYDEDADLQA